MGYHIDLQAINLNQYKNELKSGYLPPSRQMLKNDIDEHFERIAQQGIETAAELLAALKTSRKVSSFFEKSGVPQEYLTILSREIRSLIKKPIKLGEFSDIGEEAVQKLGALGIRSTIDVYEKVLREENRAELSLSSGVDGQEILKIAQLADLCRIRWVNHTFAQILLAAGYESAKQVSQADDETLHRQINKQNKQQGTFKGTIGLNDTRICIAAAAKLAHEIEV